MIRTRLLYPRSFAGLLFLGFGLVVLPSVAGMAHLHLLLDEVAERSTRQVEHTVAITRGTRRLSEAALALERAAGQLYVLEDPQLRETVTGIHEDFQGVLDALRPLPWTDASRRLLETVTAMEASLLERVMASHAAGDAEFASFAPLFDDLHGRIGAVIEAGGGRIDRGVSALGARLQAVQRLLLVQGLAVVLLSAGLALLFSWLINRPVGQLARSIRRLGENDLKPGEPVHGPQDLVYLGEQLEWLRSRLAEVEEQKQRFLHHVSHELKTPLTALKEGIELLADGVSGTPTGIQQEVLGIMRSNGEELHRRIDDLLRYDRAVRHAEQLVPESCGVDELLDAAIGHQRLALQKGGITIRREVPPVAVTGDRGKLVTVLENLLGNAIRFSPPHGVITIRGAVADDALSLVVCDQGPGVAEEDRANLFQPFYQGRHQPAGALQGTGLGLAIVREYVIAHGGRVTLRETDHEGACFQVVLPFGRSGAP